MAFCIYMGISNPGIETEINGGMTEYPDKINRSGRPTIRTLDPYGQSLSLYGAKGNFRLGMHNAVERELTEVARTCGLDPVRQDPIVFGGAIPVGPARDSYARAVRTARKTGNRNRGGLVPDVTIRNFPTIDGGLPQTRIYEVKTFGHKENRYGVQGALKPVERRDAEIPGEYETLARATDRKHCGTEAGAEGPVLRRLRALAPIRGIVVGANGEWSRGMDTFIADVAQVASVNPERFGCCHGPEQAQGVIAAMARDRLGRVALRAAAQVRVAALLAITGRSGADPGAHRGSARGTHDEWDRARDNTHVPFSHAQ
jgi:hypothetical protein